MPKAEISPSPLQVKRPERLSNGTQPMVRHYPRIIAGTCERCGTIDPNVEGQYQYQLCPHYKGVEIKCSYCPEFRNPDDVIYKSTMNITDHPNNPELLVIVCDNYDCVQKHQERFKVS